MKSTSQRYLYFLCYLAIFLLPVVHLLPILSPEITAGWDLLPHLGIYVQAEKGFLEGEVVQYSTQLGAGIPLFGLYAPGPYLLVFCVRALSFFQLSQPFAFNIVLVLMPLFAIHSFDFAVRWIVGRRFALPATIVFLASVFSPLEYSNLGITLHGGIRGGLFGSYIGFCILFYLTGLLLKDLRLRHHVTMVLCGVLTGILVYVHLLSAISAVLAASVCFIYCKHYRKRLYCITAIATVVAAPALFYLHHFYPYNSSSPIAVARGTAEPLSLIVPGMYSPAPWDLYALDPYRLLTVAGCAALLFIFFTGVVHIVKLRPRLVVLVALSAAFGLLFSRAIFYNLIPLSIHCYRLVNIFLISSALIVGYGLKVCFLDKRWPVRVTAVLATVYALSVAAFFSLSAPGRYLTDGGHVIEARVAFDPSLANRPALENLDAAFTYLETESPHVLRIAAESSRAVDLQFGSPHGLMAYLTIRQTKNEVVPSLLAESSLCGTYLIPLVNSSEELYQWGQIAIPEEIKEVEEATHDRLERLNFFGVDTILTSSAESQRILRLHGTKSIKNERTFGLLSIFHLSDAPKEKISKRYIEYIATEGSKVARVKQFRRFVRGWWSTNLYKDDIDIIFNPDLEFKDVPTRVTAKERTFITDAAQCSRIQAMGNDAVICGVRGLMDEAPNLRTMPQSAPLLRVEKYGYAPNAPSVLVHPESYIVAPCFTGTFAQ